MSIMIEYSNYAQPWAIDAVKCDSAVYLAQNTKFLVQKKVLFSKHQLLLTQIHNLNKTWYI